jgi:hypothetical protein
MAVNRKSGGGNVAFVPKRRSGGVMIAMANVRRRASGAWVEMLATVQLANRNITAATASPGTATALYEINANGEERQQLNNGTPTVNGTWRLSGAAGDYEVRVTVTSGTLSGGSGAGTWLNCGTTRSWNRVRTGAAGTDSVSFTVEIRRASNQVVEASATVTLNAQLIS